MIKTTFINSEPVAKNIYTFWFKPESAGQRKPHQIAGQFTEVSLPHKNTDNRGHKRWFTLSNSPSEDHLSITTKFNSDSSSFKKALRELQPGTELSLASPMGDFVLPKDESIPLVFVAGGIGVTPFRSILKYLEDTKQKRQITLIYGVKDKKELGFEDLIKRNTDRFIPSTDRLSADFILDSIDMTKRPIIYLSGPEGMIEKLNNELIKKGVPKTRLMTDFFPNYGSI